METIETPTLSILPPRSPRERLLDRSALVFNGIVWLAAAIVAHLYIQQYATAIPSYDDFDMVDRLLPGRRITWNWLWSQHTYHRVPLSRSIYIGLFRITSDYRFVMHGTIAALSALSVASILVMRRARGRSSFLDAFFPLLWLSLGHASNFLAGFSISFALASAAMGFVLLAVALERRPEGSRGSAFRGRLLPRSTIGKWRMTVIALSFWSMPLVGGPGLTQLPALTLWLALLGLAQARSSGLGERRIGRAMLAASLVAIALIWLYFVDFKFPPLHESKRSFSGVVATTGQFFAMSLGPEARGLWPASGWIVAGFCAATLAMLAAVLRRDRSHIVCITGLIACFLGIAAQGLSIGWSRAGANAEVGFSPRYVTSASSILSWVYVSWCLYGPRRLSIGLRTVMVLSFTFLFFHYTERGDMVGKARVVATEWLTRDVEHGIAPRALAKRHWQRFFFNEDGFRTILARYEAAGMPPYVNHDAGRAIDPSHGKLFSMMKPRPIGGLTDGPLSRQKHDGVQVLVVPVDTELRFDAQPGSSVVSGNFGLHPRALKPGMSDGMVFIVEQQRRFGPPTPIFVKVLRARKRNRGMQSFEVDLPDRFSGDVILRTSNEVGMNSDEDWGYWTNVKIR